MPTYKQTLEDAIALVGPEFPAELCPTCSGEGAKPPNTWSAGPCSTCDGWGLTQGGEKRGSQFIVEVLRAAEQKKSTTT